MGQRGPKNSFTGVTCTNRKCDMYGELGNNNIVANGTYKTKSGTVRKYICKHCGTVFNDRTGTAVCGLRTNDEVIMKALKLAVSGMSVRAISRELKVNQETIRRWLERAADHSEDVETVLMRKVRVTKVELDEMWTYIQKKTTEGGQLLGPRNMDLDGRRPGLKADHCVPHRPASAG